MEIGGRRTQTAQLTSSGHSRSATLVGTSANLQGIMDKLNRPDETPDDFIPQGRLARRRRARRSSLQLTGLMILTVRRRWKSSLHQFAGSFGGDLGAGLQCAPWRVNHARALSTVSTVLTVLTVSTVLTLIFRSFR